MYIQLSSSTLITFLILAFAAGSFLTQLFGSLADKASKRQRIAQAAANRRHMADIADLAERVTH